MLHIEGIHKSYDKREVVRGISFHVQKGESFGLLGPNGAGKSTTIGMISSIISPDKGDILVDGLSVKKKAREIKRKIGVVPQEIALYPTLSAKDNLVFWGKMYGLTHVEAAKRAEEVLAYVGLSERAREKVETFSGGMKRRTNIGASLMHRPELLIMDEPTVGIDPQSRNHILETVKELNRQGMTIIYTSHYMEEVEFLCNRIGIVDQGKMIALGTKKDLFQRLAEGTAIKVRVNQLNEAFLAKVREMDGIGKVITHPEESLYEIFVVDHQKVIGEIITQAVQAKVDVQTLEVNEPNLESLFLSLTGRSLRD